VEAARQQDRFGLLGGLNVRKLSQLAGVGYLPVLLRGGWRLGLQQLIAEARAVQWGRR